MKTIVLVALFGALFAAGCTGAKDATPGKTISSQYLTPPTTSTAATATASGPTSTPCATAPQTGGKKTYSAAPPMTIDVNKTYVATIKMDIGDITLEGEAVILADLGFYIAHRMFHSVQWLWRFHAIHHSIEELDWLAAVRVHAFDQAVTKGASILPLLALGFDTGAITISSGIYFWHSLLLHANVRMTFGPLRWLIASPVFHHWHHAARPDARGQNYAGQLSFLDKLFGMLGWVGMWPTDNYDQNQAGAYFAGYEGLGDTTFNSIAEDAVDSMVGGQYNVYPYFRPLAVVQFAQDTHSPSFGGRVDVVRFEPEGLLVLADRLVHLAVLGEGGAEVVVHHGIIRFEADGLLQLADRPVNLAFA